MKTLMIRALLPAVVFSLGAMLYSCKRDFPAKTEAPQSPNVGIKDLKAPAGFNFETFKDLTVNVSVQNPTFAGERFRINIYNNVPGSGDLIMAGFTDVTNKYTAKIRVPADSKTLWIEKVGANGHKVAEEVGVDKLINKDFKSSYTVNLNRKSGGSGMTCSSSCDNTINNGSGSYSIPNGKTWCFTGTMNHIKITINGSGTAKVCASGSIDSITLAGSGKFYLLENTIATIGVVNMTSNSSRFENYSDSLKITSAVSFRATCKNEGKMYTSSDFNHTVSNSHFTNDGYIYVSGNCTLNHPNFNNNEHLTIDGNFTVNSSGAIDNDCFLWVKGSVTNNNTINNYSYMKVGGTYTGSSNSDFNMKNGSQLSVTNLVLNKYIDGTSGDTSVVKVSNTTTINSTGKIRDRVQLCDANGVETNNGTVQSIGCSVTIATSDCNPEGAGQPAIQDTDSDGVADAQDEYPNDATRAFNSYYPSANTYATVAFEDLWPSRGDFDFNDMVINYQVKQVLNANNKVVEMYDKMYIRAIGAALTNGFGFQLDGVNASDVTDVTGYNLSKTYITLGANKTETGVTKAVIIAFDSPEPIIHRAAGSMFNTIKTNPTGTFDTLNIHISFATALDQSKLTQDKFNPFIIVNGQRDKEVHMGNFAPTTKASSSYFGTFDDASNPSGGVYYKTANGIPFAISISENFDYPIEKSDITSAYTNFAAWAISGGSSQTNWYKDLPGNRNADKIY